MVCQAAVGPRSCCRLGRQILVSSLPDIRPLAIRVGPGRCLAVDDASDPQLARPVLLVLYSFFIVRPLIVRPPQEIARRSRARLYRPDSRIGQMRMRLSGDRRSQMHVHAIVSIGSGRLGSLGRSLWPRGPQPQALVAHSVNASPVCARPLPGAHWVRGPLALSGSQPSVRPRAVFPPRPDLVASAGVPM